MLAYLRRLCGLAAIRVAAQTMRVAERLLDRRRTPTQRSVKAPDPNCPRCSGNPVPGVLWPVQINGDKTQDWIERCDECRRFDNNIQAAGELIRLGLIVELGIGRPSGAMIDAPFGPPAGIGKTSHKR